MAALTYKSPVEDVLSHFTSEETSKISQVAVTSLRDIETKHHELFNYALPHKAKEKLSNAGIYLSPYSYKPHSHPVCKTLENYFLYNVIPDYLDNSYYFVGIKDNKINFLKSRNPKLRQVEVINRFVTSKDAHRYPNFFVNFQTNNVPSLWRNKGISGVESLLEKIPKQIEGRKRNMFLHDEMHYWSAKDYFTFLDKFEPDKLIGTCVFPPEILAKSRNSLNPWAYSFKIIGKDLIFSPDGVGTESYIQPLAGGSILKISHIITPAGKKYAVNLLHSKFCHHLISITRCDLPSENIRLFNNFDAVNLSGLLSPGRDVTQAYPVDFRTVSKIYRYLMTLRKPDSQSAMAKLSQILPEPTAFEIKFTKEFSRIILETTDVNTLITKDISTKIKELMISIFPKRVTNFFDGLKSVMLDNFMSNLEPFNFIINLEEMKIGYESIFDLEDDLDLIHSDDIIENMRGFSEGPSRDPSFNHHGYKCKGSDMPDRGVLDLYLEMDSDALIKILISIFGGNLRILNYESLDKYVDEVIKIRSSNRSLNNALLYFFESKTFVNKLRSVFRRIVYRNRVNYLKTVFCLKRFGSAMIWFFSGHNNSAKSNRRSNIKYLTMREGGNWYSSELREMSQGKEGIKDGKDELRKKERGEIKMEGCIMATNRTYALKKKINSELKEYFERAEERRNGKEASTSGDKKKGKERVENKNGEGKKEKEKKKKGKKGKMTKAPEMPNEDHKSKDHDDHQVQEPQEEHQCANKATSNHEIHEISEDDLDTGLADLFPGTEDFFFEETGSVKSKQSSSSTQSNSSSSNDSSSLTGSESFKSHENISRKIRKGDKRSKKSEDKKKNEKKEKTSQTWFKKTSPVPSSRKDSSGTSSNLSNCHAAFDILGVEVKVLNKPSQNINGRRVEVIGDGNCFWHSLQVIICEDSDTIKGKVFDQNKALIEKDKRISAQFKNNAYAENEAIALFCKTYDTSLMVVNLSDGSYNLFGNSNFGFPMILENEHFEPVLPTNDCVIEAIRKCLDISYFSFMRQLASAQAGHVLLNELFEGVGLSINLIVLLLKHFEINSVINFEGKVYEIRNAGGAIHSFNIDDDHMTYGGEVSGIPGNSTNFKDNIEDDIALEMTLMRSCSKLEHTPDAIKAKTLSDSFYQGYTGVLLSKDNGNNKEILEDSLIRSIRNGFVYTLLGTFGSGKSFFYKDFTKRFKNTTFTIISPRKKLCDNLNHDLGLSIPIGSRLEKSKKKKDNRLILCTFEVFFKNFEVNSKSKVIILDEIQLFPPGFLDLLMVKLNEEKKIILCGDPCQSDYDSQKDRYIFANSNSDINDVLNGKEYKYNIVSRRFRNRNFLNRLPCTLHEVTNLKEEELVYVNSIDELKKYNSHILEVILVSSFEEKKIAYLAYNNKITVMTFGESTGLTFNFGAILVTYESIKTSDNRWITALSRFRNNIAIVNLTGAPFSELPQMFLGRPLHHFLTTKSTLAYFHDNLPGSPIFNKGFQNRVGLSGVDKENKLLGDPWLKAMLFLGDDISIEDEEVIEEAYNEECFKTHIPNVSLSTCFSEIHDKIRMREYREIRMGSEITSQFTDDHYKGMGEILTSAPERFEAIYPRHKGTDTVTFLMAVKKRLKFSNPAKEDQKLRKAMIFGDFLLKEFLKVCPLERHHNRTALEESIKEFEEKKLSKPSSTIENHSARSCSDWLADVALIFMKSQLCTKYEKRFVDAKAGQTLACFHHSVLCRFAPFIRYIEKRVNENLPKRFYIHSGKNFDDLNDYVKKQGFNGVCTESDYEAFDASQDFYILAFELKLMEHLGLPKDLINDYRYIKTNLGSKLGDFAIMRFTGEASTFLFNTLANILFTQLRYSLTKNVSICFAGDDMCANQNLKVKTENEKFLTKISLKAKVSVTTKPTFCGWFLTRYGILKNPKLVLERMCIARERNNVHNCLDSYAIEASYAYKLSERLYDVLDESEMNAHHCCIRYIVQNKSKLNSALSMTIFGGLKL